MLRIVGVVAALACLAWFEQGGRTADPPKVMNVTPLRLSAVPQDVLDMLQKRFPESKPVRAGLKPAENLLAVWILQKNSTKELEVTFKPVKYEYAGSESSVEKLPIAVSNAVEAKHPGATIRHSERIMKNKQLIGYEVNITTKEDKKIALYLTPDGKPFKP